MENKSSLPAPNNIFDDLQSKADLLTRFSARYVNQFSVPHDYGTDVPVKMMDVHILTDIINNPEITGAELAKKWNRTPGAISQIVSRLVKDDYIERYQKENNAKSILMRPTEKGLELYEAHKRYDIQKINQSIIMMLEKFTPTEIDAYFRILAFQVDSYN